MDEHGDSSPLHPHHFLRYDRSLINFGWLHQHQPTSPTLYSRICHGQIVLHQTMYQPFWDGSINTKARHKGAAPFLVRGPGARALRPGRRDRCKRQNTVSKSIWFRRGQGCLRLPMVVYGFLWLTYVILCD